MSTYDQNAFEIRQLLHAQPVVGAVQKIVFGVIKRAAKMNLKNKKAAISVWWPFIRKCFEDICMYGMCAYYKNTRGGVVVPVHVPLNRCKITLDDTQGVQLAPKASTEHIVPKRTKVYVHEQPDVEAGHLNSSFARLMYQYRRLSELSTSYIEEERRIAKPVNFLEDTARIQGGGIYQAVTASNPEWDAAVPGLTLSAKDTSDEHQKIADYVTQLQGALVDKINRGSEDQESVIDSLGIRRQEKRKRVQEIQIPLPPNKRLVQHQPSNRCNILQFEEHFFQLIPWSLGMPPVFIEARGGSVSLNTDIISTVVRSAIATHVETINEMLLQVSDTLFGTMADVMNRSMVVELIYDEDTSTILPTEEEQKNNEQTTN